MKNTRYIVLTLLASLSLSLNARTFLANDQIRVNTDQTTTSHTDPQHAFQWDYNYAVLWLYLYGQDGNEWVRLNYESAGLFVATLPEGKNYDHLILVRKDPDHPDANFNASEVWNRTCNIEIPDHGGCNVLYKFWKGGEGCDGASEWHTYTPSINEIKTTVSGVPQEEVTVCPSAAGSGFSLHPKIRNDRTNYEYDNVIRHTWLYSTDKTNWTSLDNYTDNTDKTKGKERDGEADRDFFTTLPATIPNGGIYYYLYSFDPAGRRLIHITKNSAGCDLDCSITSFETAISAVNADDNTFTLDGMVAFGESDGQLTIECEGKTVVVNSPKSPQSFSLTGVPAATTDGVTYTATAYFTGSTACTKSITFAVPNATQAMEIIYRDTLTGETIQLVPQDADPANDYVWIVNGTTYKKEDGQAQVFTIDPFSTEGEQTYTYKEFYPISGSMADMMSNGNYEEPTFDYGEYPNTSTISDYDFWGVHTGSSAINFYKNEPTGVNPSNKTDNGFAVVNNANRFAPSFAAVQARDGARFALFDAAPGAAGGNKKAWYATTTNNPNLKLKKGTTYVLSFWAANINNYGEMDNAARFKFRIEYNGHTWESRVLDLGSDEFRNNIWHQCSQTFYAEEDCDNVTISVVNLNTNELYVGNDFALDDIQFHPISSVSRVVKSQQQFVVKAHEPKIDTFTATVQPVDCDGTNYTIAMHVEYQNPNGQLIIKDKTTGDEYAYDVPSVAYDTPASLDKTITISTNEPTHSWIAYFADWTSAQKTASTVIPGFPKIEAKDFAFSEPGCSDLTTTLTFTLDYTYQQGNLTYQVDGLSVQTASFEALQKDKKTLTLTFADIPADGKNTHVLHVTFDGANSCSKDYDLLVVPFSPVINSVAVSGVPATVLCEANDYQATVTITTPYDATGRNIVLSYDDNGAQSQTVAATGTTTTATLTLHTIDGAAQTVTAAYEASTTCSQTSDAFTPPTRTSCEKQEAEVCEGESYTWHGNEYTRPIGTDTIIIGYDSLILTVHATPAIAIGTTTRTCDDETAISLPFSVISGNPDNFDIEVNGTHYSGSVSGTDLTFALSSMAAGNYAATITVGEMGTTCESTVSTSFTIADSHLMYRKWEDVLFIDNSAKRFVAYQWFENGAEIAGQTAQSLFLPDGMPGTYYCRMTTADGSVYYTCEQTFDEVTRSRDVANDQPSPVATKLIRNGQLLIEKDGKLYNACGQQVK